jgi:hypothetical protein
MPVSGGVGFDNPGVGFDNPGVGFDNPGVGFDNPVSRSTLLTIRWPSDETFPAGAFTAEVEPREGALWCVLQSGQAHYESEQRDIGLVWPTRQPPPPVAFTSRAAMWARRSTVRTSSPLPGSRLAIPTENVTP